MLRLRRLAAVSLFVVLVLSCLPGESIAQQNIANSEKTSSRAKQSTDPLLAKVNEAIDISSRRYLSGEVHSPWQILHGLLALRNDFVIKENGEKVSAVEWMSKGAYFRGDPWFQKTRYGGRAHPYTVPYAFEGHPNQSLAILAFADLPKNHKLQTPDGPITPLDMVKNAQMEVTTQEEVTWTLWALSHYLGPDARWRNKHGQEWSIESLVQIQTDEPCNDAACGGTHGLFALTVARNSYLKTGRPLRGVWLEADQKIQRYIESARAMQNSDGTFSTDYFRSSGYSSNFQERLETTGHTLEFLTLALPEERLQEQWVRNAVSAVAGDLIQHRKESVRCAPLYHALNGLVIYRDRVSSKPSPQLAGAPSERTDVETLKPVQPTEPVLPPAPAKPGEE